MKNKSTERPFFQADHLCWGRVLSNNKSFFCQTCDRLVGEGTSKTSKSAMVFMEKQDVKSTR